MQKWDNHISFLECISIRSRMLIVVKSVVVLAVGLFKLACN